MAFWILFFLAGFAGAVVKVWTKRTGVAIVIPVTLFVAYVLFDAYVLPYRGGGASMWPVAVMLGAPVVLIGAVAGAYLGTRLAQQGDDNVGG